MVLEIVSSLLNCFLDSYEGAVRDAADPTTDRFTQISQWLDQVGTLFHVCTLLAVRQVEWLRDPRVTMGLAAVARLAAAGFSSLVRESPAREAPKEKASWREMVLNPVAPFKYFWRSTEIWKFHLQRTLFLSIMVGAMSLHALYRRQVHQWTAQEFATQGLVAQVVELVAPFGTMPTIKRLGLFGTTQLGERLYALQLLVGIVVPSNLLWTTTLLAGARYDMAAGMREISHWRKAARVNFTLASLATQNLVKAVVMVMPPLMGRVYTRTRPETVFILGIVATLVHSEFILPRLWPGSERKSELKNMEH
eukprot:TRINITY_DN22944_c0_g1_i1.p1 TRINITY_DN22944_c0_g1~~TRINITY_DN22944_c0_g1_i1.p1  ORF type:complete len:308 (-),score=63.94 TRINITY_DN22944_c0_g1_i1:276-1199(-)